MMLRYFLLLSALLGLGLSAAGQATGGFGFEYRAAAPVLHGADTLRAAWAGGFDAPQFSSIDLNGDGRNDLFVFDRVSKRYYTFLDVARGSGRGWQYAPDYESYFPAGLKNWVLLRDYNCDGRPDLFASDAGGVRLFQNVTVAGGRPRFQDLGLLQSQGSGSTTPVSFGSYNMPDFKDVDGDGRLDIVGFSAGLDTILLYLNASPVACDSTRPVFTTPGANDTWGGIVACANQCNTYALAGTTTCFVAKPLHNGGHNVLLLDLDGDGDQDMLDGRDSCPDLVRLINSGTAQAASFVRAGISSQLFPTAAHPARAVNYPASYYFDADLDGQPDLVVAPNISDNITDRLSLSRVVNLYRNSSPPGTSAQSFDYVPGGFLHGDMLDVSEGAAPAFGDLDGDGLTDMLLANNEDLVGQQHRGTISHYRNVGTATQPAFRLVTADYMGLSVGRFAQLRPVLVDLDRNGRPDLAFDGRRAGANRLFFLLNTTPAGQPAAFNLAALDSMRFLPNTAGAIFTKFDAPCFTDVDGDGFVDLLFGTNDGNSAGGSLRYFRNRGTGPLNTAFELANDDLGQLLDAEGLRPQGLSPVVADFDGDGQPDLLTWDSLGDLTFYADYRRQPARFIGRTDLVFNQVSGTYQPLRLGYGTYINHTLAAADLNADGVPELLIGTQTGGVVSYQVTRRLGGLATRPAASSALAVQLHPNPATARTTVETARPTRLTLLDLVGRTISQPALLATRHELSLSGLAPGLYLVRAEAADGTAAVRRLEVR